jgi:hypothetical protein
MPMSDPRFEQEQIEQAAREAAGVGGRAGDEDLPPAERPVREAGGGESEGFEQAEQALIEHASHGDQQSAHDVLHRQGRPEEQGGDSEDAVAGDHLQSTELADD